MEKEQIKVEIENLKVKIKKYKTELSSYKSATSYIQQLINSLKRSKNALDSSEKSLKKGFTINDKTIDGGKINQTSDHLYEIIETLDYKITENINSRIQKLSKDINTATDQLYELERKYYS